MISGGQKHHGPAAGVARIAPDYRARNTFRLAQ
jgi:hypothetical protein